MIQPEHLTEEQFARYRNRSLSVDELLGIDDHLAECEPCRDRLYIEERANGQLRQLRAEISGHLTYEQVVAAAEGSSSAEAAEHLRDCPQCRAEVEDLGQFRRDWKAADRSPVPMPVRSTRWRLPAAAAVLLAAGITSWLLWHTSRPSPATPTGYITVTVLNAEQERLVSAMVNSRKVERAAILDRLITHRSVLLGAPPAATSFDLIGPMGTTEVTDRPTFRWRRAEGATSYVVALFDENFQKLVESPPVTGTEWTPEQPLTRGRIYNWQVNATIGGRTIHAPTPPAGEARFQVVSAEVSEPIQAALKEHPEHHLLLAALYARAGALDEAARELEQVNGPLAADLRQSLAEIRKADSYK